MTSSYLRSFIFIVILLCIIGSYNKAHSNNQKTILKLSLQDAINLTYKNNRTIKNSTLQRKSDLFDLKVEKDKFYPDLNFQTVYTRASDINSNKSVSRTRDVYDKYGIATSIALTLKTGAKMSLNWDRYLKKQSLASRDYINSYEFDIKSDLYQESTELRITQPLRKKFGFDVNLGSVKIAEINEKISQETLKKTKEYILTETILAYRYLQYAQKKYEISKESLDVAMKQYIFNKKLVEKGRMAPLDLVQSETDVANKKIDIVLYENQLQKNESDLIRILDIDSNISIHLIDDTLIDNVEIDEIDLNEKKLIKIAFSNNSDLLISKLQIKIAEINLLIASNQKKIDISFTAGYSKTAEFDHFTNIFSKDCIQKADSWDVGLIFSHTMGDYTDEQIYSKKLANLRIAKNNFYDQKETIRLSILEKIREVKLRKKQVELAQKAKFLTRKKLNIELKKLNMGRSSNFQIVSFQNDLVTAKTNELLAIIEFFNSITMLNQSLGIVLLEWIPINKKTKKTGLLLKPALFFAKRSSGIFSTYFCSP
ncbi:outer membrane efflux protein [Candidatus Magnetomorum sp. HK-1]|nr:outer membrane efflux protein [Candidatus Magnetomorum sp. HK-1]